MQLALGRPQFTAVDVHVADLGVLECLAFGAVRQVFGKPRNAMADEASVERTPGQLGDAVPEAAQQSSSGRSVRLRNSTTMASSASVKVVERGFAGPIAASAVVVRLRHFRTVLGSTPYWRARARDDACASWSSAERAASFGRYRGARLPKSILLLTRQE